MDGWMASCMIASLIIAIGCPPAMIDIEAAEYAGSWLGVCRYRRVGSKQHGRLLAEAT